MPSTRFVFFGPIGKTRWPPGLWLAKTFSTSPLKPLNRIQWNLIGSKISTPSTKFMFLFGRSEKQNGRPGLWLAETFSTSPMKPLNRIQWNLIGSKISMPSTEFVFFWPIGKTKWPPWPLIGWDIFDFSETAERNLWIYLGEVRGCTYSCICMGTYSQPLLIRTAWWMFMKLGKDEVLMAPYMHLVPFWCQIFDAFIVLGWATVAHMGLLFLCI